MQKLWTKLGIVIAVLILAASAATPPEKKLRLGKDLRGGVTLVYSVEIDPGDSSRQILSSVIDVLKDRVDPRGLYEISMVPQGRDRIEITMPLPGDDVKAKKAIYEQALQALDKGAIKPRDVDRAMAKTGPERDKAFEAIAGGDTHTLDALKKLAEAADKAKHLRENYDQAVAAGADEQALEAMAQQVADAEIAYEEARKSLVGNRLTSAEVRRVLRLSDRQRRLYDPKTNEAAELPSPRSRALERLRKTYPNQVDQLEDILHKYEAYESIRTTLDDPADLERLLRASGVLSFRITVNPGFDDAEEDRLRQELHENGPHGVKSVDMGWYKINKIENWYNSVDQMKRLEANPQEYFVGRGYVVDEYDGEYYMLCWNTKDASLTPDTDRNWKVARAFRGTDQLGRPAINFTMDPYGAKLLGKLTEAHIQDQMAVLLDDEVYTAPNLNSRISRQGQIMGDFSTEELNYIIRVLNSGSLQNKLSPAPISRNSVGPELGLDYLRQGLSAGVMALIAISLFMIIYYFKSGVIAVIGLACNGLLLLGIMSAMNATFTLPGIAGIILTFGMAVDSNVLIFERIREELRDGRDSKTAVRLGFSKAMSSIVDGNVTNLIVTIVLANVGTQEIKGFAITLGVGVITTMFSALVITRVIFEILLAFGWLGKLRMLPTVFPALERAFEPNINWLKLRGVFIVISTIYVGIGLSMVFMERGKLMDTEFRGGTQVTLQFKMDEHGTRKMLSRKTVEEKVHEIADNAPSNSSLVDLRTAEILPLDPQPDGVTSDQFMIKSVVVDEQAVRDSLMRAFADYLDSQPPLTFTGIEAENLQDAPVYPLVHPRGLLGPDIGKPQYLDDVSDYSGGVAIVLDHLSPKPTKASLEARIAQMREQPDFSDTSGRTWEVRVLEGTPDAVESAVVLVADPAISYLDNPDRWDTDMGEREWKLTKSALVRTTTLASVQSFSPAMAESFRAKAVVAVFLSLMLILIYVWVRFGSVRYSLAAIACLAHDCLTTIGLIAMAEIISEWSVTESFASQLGIRPFKIDLNMIAALLTIIGYSLNDTIIVMDRIREMKGKLPYATDVIINRSINMTISRTVITSGTTLLAVLILYVFGGEGVRGFAYAMFIGVSVGTYSSVAVAAPLIWRKSQVEKPETTLPTTRQSSSAGT